MARRLWYFAIGKSYPTEGEQKRLAREHGYKDRADEAYGIYVDRIGRRAPGKPERPMFDLVAERQADKADELWIYSPIILGGSGGVATRFRQIGRAGITLVVGRLGKHDAPDEKFEVRIRYSKAQEDLLEAIVRAGVLGKSAIAKFASSKVKGKRGRKSSVTPAERDVLRLVWATDTESTVEQLETKAGWSIGRPSVAYSSMARWSKGKKGDGGWRPWPERGTRPDLKPSLKKLLDAAKRKARRK